MENQVGSISFCHQDRAVRETRGDAGTNLGPVDRTAMRHQRGSTKGPAFLSP